MEQNKEWYIGKLIDQSKYKLTGNLAIYKGGKQQFYSLTETIQPYYEGMAAYPLIEVHQVGENGTVNN